MRLLDCLSTNSLPEVAACWVRLILGLKSPLGLDRLSTRPVCSPRLRRGRGPIVVRPNRGVLRFSWSKPIFTCPSFHSTTLLPCLGRGLEWNRNPQSGHHPTSPLGNVQAIRINYKHIKYHE